MEFRLIKRSSYRNNREEKVNKEGTLNKVRLTPEPLKCPRFPHKFLPILTL